MIKVFMSGTAVYKLCFARRRYSAEKRRVTREKLFAAIERGFRKAAEVGNNERQFVLEAVKTAFEGKPLYETTAIIYLADAKKGEAPVAKATVRQNPIDPHTPEQGRQAALKKLLNRDPKLFGGYLSTFGKGEREAIWTAYAQRPRGPVAPAPSGAPAKAEPVQAPARTKVTPRPGQHAITNKVIGFFATNRRTH